MTGRLILFVMLGTMVLGAGSPNQQSEYDGNLPRELRELAQKIGCRPVPGFYDKPGHVDPPYFYGWPPKKRKEETAAFWCYRKDESKPYLLVFVEGLGDGWEGRISSSIPWNSHPRGLSLWDSEHVPLSDFRYLDNPEERGPLGKTTTYAPLQDYYDGVSILFYKEGDRWLYRILH